jgi:cysteine desulfurase/selenocysteine lyase
MSNASIKNWSNEFPQLNRTINGKKLVYLDNAATTLKHKSVSDLMHQHDLSGAANVHRGAHYLSDRATFMFEESREKIAQFLNAKSKDEIIFTSGTTAGLNLLAHSLMQQLLQRSSYSENDEILLTEMEHHSNIVPWQLASQGKVKINAIPANLDGTLNLDAAKKMITKNTKVLSLTHISNATGVINPVKELIVLAKKVGAIVVIDAAQSVALMPIDVQELDCDFMVFSGHKIFGPFGTGVVWGKQGLLDSMPPYQGGGSMISEVTFEKTTYLTSPHRFEAGTPNITGVIGLCQAIRFVDELDRSEVFESETRIANSVKSELSDLYGITIFGNTSESAPIVSFSFKGAHSSDLGHLLNEQGIAVRTGHHCCQPLMRRLGVTGTVRASFSLYNTEQDAEIFVSAIKKAARILQ